MTITSMTVEGPGGRIEITKTGSGAMVTRDHSTVLEFPRDGDREERFAMAQEASCLVYGTRRGGRPAATNSMVHDLLDAVERVGGF